MLVVAFDRATHKEVDLRQRLRAWTFFRQRAGIMTWTEGRLEAIFLPHPELRTEGGDASESRGRHGRGHRDRSDTSRQT